MTLDSLTRGAQRHVQAYLDGETRQLLTILCLPLVDGVFATMLVSGSIQTFSDIVAVSLTIFAGAGALAVIFSSTENSRHARRTVLKAAPLLILGAVLISLVAPVYEQLVSIAMMQKVAGLALLVIAGKMLEVSYMDKVSVPVVVATGAFLSLQNPSSLAFTASYVLPAVATALLASAVLFAATFIQRDIIRVSAFRKGAASVLVVIALPMFGVSTPPNAALLTLSASVVYSLDLQVTRIGLLRGESARAAP